MDTGMLFNLADFQREISNLPNISVEAATRMAAALSRDIKAAERAARVAVRQVKVQPVMVEPAPYVRVTGGLLSLALLGFES